jgi:hypothetical protein
MTSRTHNTAGYLHVDRSCLRLPLPAVCRLQRLLARAIVAAKSSEPCRPCPRPNTTAVRKARS